MWLAKQSACMAKHFLFDIGQKSLWKNIEYFKRYSTLKELVEYLLFQIELNLEKN